MLLRYLIILFCLTWVVFVSQGKTARLNDAEAEALSQDSTGLDSPRLNNLLKALSSAEPDTARVRLLNEIAREYRPINSSQSLRYAEEALLLARQANFLPGQGVAYQTVGIIADMKSRYPKALENYARALEIFQQLQDTVRIAGLYSNIGLAYYHISDYQKALANYLSALTLFEKTSNMRGIAGLSNNMGMIYWKQQQYESALESYRRALEIFRTMNNTVGEVSALNNIGLVYAEQHQYDQAREAYQTVLATSQKIQHQNGIASALINLGNIYLQQGQYQRAQRYLTRAVSTTEGSGDQAGTAEALNLLAQTYLRQQSYDTARRYLRQSRRISRRIGAVEEEMDTHQLLAQLDSTQGNYLGALTHFQLYISLHDSIDQVNRSQQIAEAQIRYEIEETEKENELLRQEATLRAQELDAQKASLERQDNTILMVTACLLLVLLLAAALLYFYRAKRRDNALLQALNQEMQKQKEEIIQQSDRLRQAYEEISQANAHLEKAVRERTRKLEHQNQQLIRYTFYNAHKLRGPLARLLGLVQLTELTNLPQKDREEAISHMKGAALELDTAVREINLILQQEDIPFLQDPS